MNAEDIFLAKCEDLEARLKEGTIYSNIAASAIVRLFFFEENPLVDQVNRTYRFKFTFDVSTHITPDWEQIGFKGFKPLYSILANVSDSPLPRATLTKKEFYAHPIVKAGSTSFSTKDVVKFVAHVRGGVHFGQPDDDQKLLAEFAEFAKAYLGGLFGQMAIEPSVYAIRGIAQATLAGLSALRHAILVSQLPPFPRVWRVPTTVREIPVGFPGKSGALGWIASCPPTRIGDLCCLPGYRIVPFDSENIPINLEAQTLHVPFSVPAELPLADGRTVKVGDPLFIRHPPDEPIVLAHLTEEPGRFVLAIWFDPHRPMLNFRYENLEIQLDCGWAAGLQGTALFKWEPGRISIIYAVRLASGEYKQAMASSPPQR